MHRVIQTINACVSSWLTVNWKFVEAKLYFFVFYVANEHTLSNRSNCIFICLITASNERELAVIEMSICPCIAAVSRTWSSLHADEPNVRPDVSRAVKGLLDAVVIRIATSSFSQSSQKRRWMATSNTQNGDSEDFEERSVLSPRVRQMLNTGLLFPILHVIDAWALQQSKIGLKPATAVEVLRKLITLSGKREDLHQKSSYAPTAHASVGGVSGLKAKANLKKQRLR